MRNRILIVDDNEELLDLLCIAVQAAGFDVVRATDGIDALNKARTLRPNLLVLDLVLPELDGFAVCETLRRERDMAGVPVIMLTGLTSEFTRYAGLESGANEYVKKPVSPADLVSKIRHWLDISAKSTDLANRSQAGEGQPVAPRPGQQGAAECSAKKRDECGTKKLRRVKSFSLRK